MQRFHRLLAGSFGLLLLAAPVRAEDETPAECEPAAKLVEFSLSGMSQEEPAAFNPFGPMQRNFRQSLEMLREIAVDPDVHGIRFECGSSLDFARSIDVLRELQNVKNAGKKIVCYTDSLDRNSLLYASTADFLMLPPSGLILLEGITAELMYVKDLLEKLHASVEVIHIGDYKTAFEDYSRSSMSDAQRETINDLLGEFYGQLVKTIARNRDLTEAQVEVAFDKVFLDPAEALAMGLVDQVGYEDEFDSQLKEMFGGKVDVVDDYGEEDQPDIEKLLSNPLTFFSALPQLLDPKKPELPEGPKIAVVYCSGAIHEGKSQQSFGGSTSMGSATIVGALEKALEDDEVKAVVLRVNSPGGSALASDLIWRAVQRVREKKPVVASMGSVAASGGYWISMGCDKIVAQPSTITGSIGVVSMLPNLSQSLAALGINVEVVGAGPHVEDLSILANGPSELLKNKLRAMMESTYQTFLQKVAEGRSMTTEQVHKYAQGRVWTGRQAHEIGLVDGLGGLKDSIILACYLAKGLDPETTPVLEFPERPNFFDQLDEMMGNLASVDAQLERTLSLVGLSDVAPLMQVMLENRRPLDPRNIHAVLPVHFRIR